MTSPPRRPLFSHTVPGGAAWSALVSRGRTVTLTAQSERANVTLLLYAAADPVDRMNVPDTLKAQYSACIKAPMVLMSDRGIALASVTDSALDWHDALCGHGLSGYGESSYATDRNEWRRSARAGLLAELRKHGRGEIDLHASVNFFSKVAIDGAGRLAFDAGHARAGDSVSLRSEVDVLLVMTTAPHPLDPVWRPSAVTVDVSVADPVASDDPSRTFRSESARAIEQAAVVFA